MANELSGEERLIARYFRPLATHPAALRLVDDAAALEPPAGCDLVLKTDGLIGGVHFFPDDPADAVAKKALRVNLSDLAAKGARPLGFCSRLHCHRRLDRNGLNLSRAGWAKTRNSFRSRCSAAILIARLARSPSRSRLSAQSHTAKWSCVAARGPETGWS